MRELVCERCGTDFTCGKGAPGCWCERIAPTPGLQQELSRAYSNCLCGNCLQLAARRTDHAGTASPNKRRRQDPRLR